MLKEFMPSGRILPLKGLLLNREVVGDVSKCVCPPYDVIEEPDRYYRISPYNVVRIELPMNSEGKDKYEVAKETISSWISQGVLCEDSTDSIYVCEQIFPFYGETVRRLGFLSLVRLDNQMILRHEKTRSTPKKDRERLLLATKTFTSFVFGMYVDDGDRIEDLLQKSEKELLYDFMDEGEIACRFYRMKDKTAENILKACMEDKKVYIADGHHRLDVAAKLKLTHIPMYLTSMFGEGIRILPYHRLIRFEDPGRAEEVWNLLCNKTKPTKYPASWEKMEEIGKRIIGQKELSFSVMIKGDPENIYLFEDFDLKERPKGPTTGRLKIQLIHEAIIKGLLGVKESEIDFSPWFDRVVEKVSKGMYHMAFFCPSIEIKEVKEVAEAKSTMPPKSTFFYPKIPTGPIFFRYEEI